ncbi:MAG TPA: Nif3-like dinuclear metal center hexameric protein [Gemmatimonadaceae bacterium]|nr:Nif3-like dinuclear metal center hexameric protein [Gemmatimonadaceae bacterium]
MNRAFLVALLVAPLGAAGAQGAPTAAELVARIKEHAGVEVRSTTVDTFKAGDPQARVKGVAVTMMATLDVLKRAVARGDNFVITHEPTFYTARDTLAVLESENDSMLALKQKYIVEHGLIIWRFHDTPHAMQPDMIAEGMAHALGWEKVRRKANVFELERVSIRALATSVGAKLGARAIRISGDPNARVSKVVMTYGFPGFAANRHLIQAERPEVIIIGEDHEWETIEYVADEINAGRIKGMIVLGHVPSEQAGMDEAARWMRGFVREVPVHFVPTDDPFRPLK